MDILDLARTNLLSPIVLCFVLGVAAVYIKSDLKFPDQVAGGLSIYLMLSIGLKGGVELSQTPFASFIGPLIAALGLCLAIPVWCYAILRKAGRLAVADAAALAAHYGSVSAVTFVAVQTYLDAAGITYEGFAPALLAVMEVPAIVVALAIAKRAGAKAGAQSSSALDALRAVTASKSVLLLVGGLVIGALAGPSGYAPVKPVFTDLFRGLLCLFLLDLGLQAGQRLKDFAKVGPFLVGFAVVIPLFHAGVAVMLGQLVGLSTGGAAIFATLAASSSYIAAPAAVRLALPEANPGYYLTASLALTFPFNLMLGIPIYLAMAQWAVGPGG